MNEVIYRHSHGALGDSLCFISAIRKLARLKGVTLHIESRQNLLSLYGDNLLAYGNKTIFPHFKVIHGIHPREDYCVDLSAYLPAEQYCKNLAGVFMKSFHMSVTEVPEIEVPKVARLEGLPEKYIAFQPASTFARNPPIEFLNKIVSRCRDVLPIVLFGKPDTQRFDGTFSQFLGDEYSVLSVVSHASLVLCPRSAGAHIAAGYHKPSVVWMPPKCRMNWHLNYPDWPCKRADFDRPDWFTECLEPMVKEIEK